MLLFYNVWMLLKIVLGMRGNQSSGWGRGSHKANPGHRNQNIVSGTNPTTSPLSPTYAEESLPAQPSIATSPLDTRVSQGTNIPSSSNAEPVANLKSNPHGASVGSLASATAASSQTMHVVQMSRKVYIKPSHDKKQ